MKNQHEPKQDFVSRLEWQLLSELRRDQRFSDVLPGKSPNGRLRFVLTVLLCFSLGVMATMAAQYLRNSPQQQYLMAKAESDLDVAKARVLAARETLEWLESEAARQHQLYRDEAQRQREIKIAQEGLEDAELQLRSRQLDWEEIGLTHQIPGTVLWAPLIDGRDFVSERLQIKLEVRKREWAKRLEDVAKMRDAGEDERSEKTKTQNVVTKWGENEIRKMERFLSLRQSYLNGEITKSELARASRSTEDRDRLNQLTDSLEHHRDRIQELRSGFEDGFVSPLRVSEAEIHLKEMEALEGLLRLEIDLFEKSLEPAPYR